MTVIDTNVVIERVKSGREITENITEVTAVEYPPIITYVKFHGDILVITRKTIGIAVELQRRLRKVGKPKQFADLMIAAICIANDEKLVTHDSDFIDIAEVSELSVEVI